MIGELRGVPTDIPARQRKRPTKPLGQLVEDLLAKHHIGRSSPEQSIRDHWPEVVGATNAQYSHAVTIDARGKLIVLAQHAVVRQELSMHRRMIVSRIQKLAGCSHVRELTVRAG